jgi:hypothetical protein
MTFAPIGPDDLTDASKKDRITFFNWRTWKTLWVCGLTRNLRPSGSNIRMEIGFFMIDVSRLVQVFAKRFLKNGLAPASQSSLRNSLSGRKVFLPVELSGHLGIENNG